jgi:hypothetical protein
MAAEASEVAGWVREQEETHRSLTGATDALASCRRVRHVRRRALRGGLYVGCRALTAAKECARLSPSSRVVVNSAASRCVKCEVDGHLVGMRPRSTWERCCS